MAKEIPDIDRLIMPGSEEKLRWLDRLKMVPDLFLKGGLALAGYQSTGHWTGALTALVGLRLATGNNLAGGVAGVTALTLLGLNTAFKPKYDPSFGMTHEQWCELNRIQGYNPPGCP